MKSIIIKLAVISLGVLATSASADPMLTTWMTEFSGQYARIYESKEDASANNAVSTWTTQALPAYADIQRVEYSDDWVYINTTGLASHLMGPWYFDDAKSELFNNLPLNTNTLTQIPRFPREAASKEINQLGSLGLWVNGVGLYNMLDGAFYDDGAESQDGGEGSLTSYWVRNAMFVEVVTFDNTNGHQPPSGDYHYHADPKALRYQLNDNVRYEAGTGLDNSGVYYEDKSNLTHSPILGWAYDGYPIYGPYGYDDPDVAATDTTVRRIVSGFVARDGNNGTVNLAETGRVSLAKWAAEMRGLTTDGPSLTFTDTSKVGPVVDETYVIGYWIEDHAYLGDLGFTQGVDFDLDIYNGHFCRTPEYPEGTYAYFVTIDENDEPAFPYAIGRQWYGEVTGSGITEITEDTTVLIEAGPASEIGLSDYSFDSNTDMITLSWTSVEGGQYSIQASDDLESWDPVEESIASTALETQGSTAVPGVDAKFYRVVLDAVDDYDSEGAVITGPGGGGDGGPPGGPGGGGNGGNGGVAGTGNAMDGFVFSFQEMPPLQNLATNFRVGAVAGTVVNYFSQGLGGTITISFDDSGLSSGSMVRASFNHQPEGQDLVVETSAITYTKP